MTTKTICPACRTIVYWRNHSPADVCPEPEETACFSCGHVGLECAVTCRPGNHPELSGREWLDAERILRLALGEPR